VPDGTTREGAPLKATPVTEDCGASKELCGVVCGKLLWCLDALKVKAKQELRTPE